MDKDQLKDVNLKDSKGNANQSFENSNSLKTQTPPAFQLQSKNPDSSQSMESPEEEGLQLMSKKYASAGDDSPPDDNPSQLKPNSEKFDGQSFQLQSKSKSTGLPDNLKSGIENMSGYSMDDVNVHYNSEKPAQLNAHAFAQGSDIHVSKGQERHLPHEAWHVVQQKQNRVTPTIQNKGVGINDNPSLESEADRMGEKAVNSGGNSGKATTQMKASSNVAQLTTTNVTLPETLGPRQEGSVAVRGSGDANAFSPNDVNQGSIGDCYFLASLSAVAHTNPALLQNAITENSDGTYSVRLYRKREQRILFWRRQVFTPVTIILYPTFPISADGTDTANPDAAANPAHAHGGDQSANGNTELWVRLFEKAYALLIGSYGAIGNGGLGADAMETLTGQEFREEVLNDDTKARIIEMVEDGVPVEVGTSTRSWDTMSDEDKRFARENSIVGGHAYSVVSASESNITVRNPWGTGARNATPTLTWAQFDAMFWQFSNQQ
jgi:hypothetical protein